MKSKIKRLLLIFGIVVVAGAGVGYFLFGSANEGEILARQDVPKHKNTETPAPKDLASRYIRLEYPGLYMQGTLPVNDQDLELSKLRAGTTYEKQITVIVSNLPGGKLDQNSAYMLRKSRPDMYTKRMVPTAKGQAEVYVNTDGQEQTAFMVQNGKLATLAFVQRGGDVKQFVTEVDTVLKSFAWL